MDEQKVILEHLNKNFKYVYDKNAYGKRDAWYVMKQVPFEGDCEDYSLTYLYEVSGRSYIKMFWNLIFGGYKIKFCTVRGEGHAVLRYKERYLDNIQKEWCRKDYLEDKGYDFHKSQYWWNIVAVKLVQGWYYSASKKNSRLNGIRLNDNRDQPQRYISRIYL